MVLLNLFWRSDCCYITIEQLGHGPNYNLKVKANAFQYQRGFLSREVVLILVNYVQVSIFTISLVLISFTMP